MSEIESVISASEHFVRSLLHRTVLSNAQKYSSPTHSRLRSTITHSDTVQINIFDEISLLTMCDIFSWWYSRYVGVAITALWCNDSAKLTRSVLFSVVAKWRYVPNVAHLFGLNVGWPSDELGWGALKKSPAKIVWNSSEFCENLHLCDFSFMDFFSKNLASLISLGSFLIGRLLREGSHANFMYDFSHLRQEKEPVSSDHS